MSFADPLDLALAVGFTVALALAVSGLRLRQTTGAVRAEASTGEKKPPSLLKIGLIAGSIFLGLILLRECYLLLMRTSPMPAPAYQIIRATVGLGAGFIAAGLAGSFDITGSLPNVSIKAGGPTGVAIFFYLVNPMDFTVTN